MKTFICSLIIVSQVMLLSCKEKTNKNDRYLVTSSNGLYLRSDPSYKSALIIKIPENENVYLLNDSDVNPSAHWLYVCYKEYEGWVEKEYVIKNTP